VREVVAHLALSLALHGRSVHGGLSQVLQGLVVGVLSSAASSVGAAGGASTSFWPT
jgi:hypothetical protein